MRIPTRSRSTQVCKALSQWKCRYRKSQLRFWSFANANGSAALLCLVLAGGVTCAAQGWDKAKPFAPSVIVTPGTPHAWTMEQAHYLLERNRAHDLGILEADPGALNPNDTVGFRIESLRTLLSASVSFDQSIGVKNRATLDLFNQQLATHNALMAQQQALSVQQTALAFQLAQAQSQLTVLNAASTPDKIAIAIKQAEVTKLQADTAALNTQMAALAAATPALPTAPPGVTATAAPDALGTNSAIGDDPNFDTLLKSFSQGPAASKLSAKTMLDNYVDFQYEMVAKQLTLLRDQAGPDNRVLFLELPHSIYVTNKVHPYPYIGGVWGDHLVQAWWKVDGGLMATPLCNPATQGGVHRPPTARETYLLTIQDIKVNGANSSPGCPTASEVLAHNQLAFQAFYKPDNSKERHHLMPASINQKTAPGATASQTAIWLDSSRAAETMNHKDQGVEPKKADSVPDATRAQDTPVLSTDRYTTWASQWGFDSTLNQSGAPGTITAPIYTLDLIPRQDSLNVAEASSSTRQTGFAGVFSWLSGLGAKARYERQQQQASQFTQTEQYASAFGKGDYKFGWTFAPKPGTNQVDAGTRTTYVVLVVPRNTRIVRLNAVGCGYRRRNVPRDPFSARALDNQSSEESLKLHKLDEEDCGGLSTFDVEVPDSDDNFWIDSAAYAPVVAGQRTTLTLTGRLGDQVGILVNGTPLQKVPSITQPALTPSGGFTVPPNAGDSGINGVFELVHNRSSNEDTSSNLVASFTMPATFVGTPRITVVSAAREVLLGGDGTHVPAPKPSDGSHRDMFYAQPAISRVDAAFPDADHVQFTIVGHGFDANPQSTLRVGPTGYSTTPGAMNRYAVVAEGAILQVTVPRSDVFPSAAIDYISMDGGQPLDANYPPRNDDGPPKLAPCPPAKAATAADGKSPVTFTLKGDYFLATATVKLPDDPAAIATFRSQSEFSVAATLTKIDKPVNISITQGKSQPVSMTCSITAPPAPKAAPKIGAKAAPTPATAAPAAKIEQNPSPKSAGKS